MAIMGKSALLTTSAVVALTFASAMGAQAETKQNIQGQAVHPAQANAAPAASSGEIETVIVQARKRAENIQNVPLAITSLSASELQAAGQTDFVDLQRTVPSLELNVAGSNPTALFLTIRGQGQSDSLLTLQSAVGVYVDGVYIPRQNGLQAALYDLDHVEVLKGPQGTLFGKNTTGGAIQIFTKQPGNEAEGFITAKYGSYNMASFGGAYTLPIIQDKLSVRFSGELTNRDPIEKEWDGTGVGNINEKSGRVHILFTPNNDLSMELSAWGTDSRSGGYRSRMTYVTTDPTSLAVLDAAAQGGTSIAAAQAALASEVGTDRTFATGQFARSTVAGVSGTITYNFNDHLQAKSITAFEEQNDDIFNDIDGTRFDINQTEGIVLDHYFSEEFQLAGDAFDNKLNWVTGVYYNLEYGHDGSHTAPFTALLPNSHFDYLAFIDDTAWSVFAQATYALTSRLNITGGVRWTDESNTMTSYNSNTTFGTTTCGIPASQLVSSSPCQSVPFKADDADYSYLASIDYHVTDDVMVYVKTARSFRGGGNQLRGSSALGTFAPYKPEIATDYEVGMKGSFFDDRLRLDLDYYHTDGSNVQKSVIVPVGGATGVLATIVSNAASTKIDGFELEAHAKPTPQWTVSGTLGYVYPKYVAFSDSTGDRSHEPWPVPRYTYSLATSYVFPVDFGAITARADWSWKSSTVLYPTAVYLSTVTQPGFGLLNLRLTASIEKYDTDVSLFGKNVADKQYYSNFLGIDHAIGTNIGYLGEPRILGVEITKHF